MSVTEYQNMWGKTNRIGGESKKTKNKWIHYHRDFNTPLSEMDTFHRQKISKDKGELNIINQISIIDVDRLLYPITSEYTFFSSSQGTFTCNKDY